MESQMQRDDSFGPIELNTQQVKDLCCSALYSVKFLLKKQPKFNVHLFQQIRRRLRPSANNTIFSEVFLATLNGQQKRMLGNIR